MGACMKLVAVSLEKKYVSFVIFRLKWVQFEIYFRIF